MWRKERKEKKSLEGEKVTVLRSHEGGVEEQDFSDSHEDGSEELEATADATVRSPKHRMDS